MSASLRPLTLAEFLDWERRQPERYEFDGIQPVAMTGASIGHARLVLRLATALGRRLPPGCEAFAGDLKVLTATGRARYPDVTVVCGTLDPTEDIVEPVLVAEVLSPSTALTDRRVKPGDYAAVASIAVYVILEQEAPRALVLRRSAGWESEPMEGLATVLALPELGTAVALRELYG
jgi:Uma2 family endonuclease